MSHLAKQRDLQFRDPGRATSSAKVRRKLLHRAMTSLRVVCLVVALCVVRASHCVLPRCEIRCAKIFGELSMQ